MAATDLQSGTDMQIEELRVWLGEFEPGSREHDMVHRAIERIQAQADDKLRLDYLDGCASRLNDHYGTDYGWTLIQNHNVNRLMLGHMQVDLNDSAAGNRKQPSCRAAIDERIREVELGRRARELANG